MLTRGELTRLIEQSGEIVEPGEYEIKTVNGIERVSFNAVCAMAGDMAVIQYTFLNFDGATYFAAVLADGDDFSLIEPYKIIIDTIRPVNAK